MPVGKKKPSSATGGAAAVAGKKAKRKPSSSSFDDDELSAQLAREYPGNRDEVELRDADVLDTSDEEETVQLQRSWAHKTEGRGDMDQGEEDADVDEEQAAIEMDRLQKQQLTLDDFQVPGIDLSSAPATAKGKKGSKKAVAAASTAGLFAEPERVAKQLAKVSESERLQLLKRDAPEFDRLIQEFNEHLQLVQGVLLPTVQKVKAGELPTSQGSDLLEAKLHLLLNYCMCIVFYLLLKVEGKPVKGHPVIAKLVELRTYLQKLRPLESRVRSSIDRLLQMATLADKNPAGKNKKKRANDGDGEDEAADDGIDNGDGSDEDPLLLKPNLKNLAPARRGGLGDEGEGENENEDVGGGLYKAAKDPTRLGTAMETKQERKARKAKALRQEIEDYEDDTYHSYQMTREQRLQLEAAEKRKDKRGLSELATEERFEDESDDEMQTLIQQIKKRQAEEAAQKKEETTGKGKGKKAKAAAVEDEGEEDDLFADLLGDDAGPKRKRKRAEAEAKAAQYAKKRVGDDDDELLDDNDEIDSDEADGDDLDAIMGSMRHRNRSAHVDEGDEDAGDDGDDLGPDADEDDDDEGDPLGFTVPAPKRQRRGGDEEEDAAEKQPHLRRRVTRDILRNKGLEPTRNKKHKTPRTAMRKKFQAADTKHKSQVQPQRVHQTFNYTGEKNISMHVVRGKRLK
eukprot:TRINITY_DN82438_c0_g1_i1.p1 TRINITY_DN82438_c0_g1~~TRINITY_DN82438_c0_g1_i1.p1  ORF type:complete len:702 (+),score=214.88 TRINITY_DN82438_c0_g1_i1:56-2107(+)